MKKLTFLGNYLIPKRT